LHSFFKENEIINLTKTNSVIMNTLSYKTVSANSATVNKEWVLVDADGQTLGRLASKIAKLIRGKHKPNFTPHVDCGDNVVVINAEKINLTGKKWTDKSYIRHTGYPGGQRSLTATEMFEKDPTRLVEKAVKGMLPKNILGSALFRNLYVYAGTEHKHDAQNPKAINLNDLK
jgi:large subunit ribosomal protein L13